MASRPAPRKHTVVPLRGAGRERPRRRPVGRAWINGREVAPDSRFAHLRRGSD